MRKFAVALALGTALATTPTLAFTHHESSEATEAELPRYSAQAFFDTTSFQLASSGGMAFSPDGSHVMIGSDQTGIFNAYALPIAGGAPVALTASTVDSISPVSMFAEGDRLLFSRDNGGDELDHIFVREADGTERDLTPGENVKARFVGWSVDKSTFYISTNERDPGSFDLYAYDAADYSRELIFENDGYGISAFSPDGRYVALNKPRTADDGDIYLADLIAGGEPKLITPHDGNIAYGGYTFTPDSRALIYATNEAGEFSQAWRHDIATGEKTPLIQPDWDVSYVAYSPSGRYRVHSVNEDAVGVLHILDTQSGEEVELTGVPEGQAGQVRFNADESMIAFSVQSDVSPTDIYVADLATGASRRLTTALNPDIDGDQLVDGEVVRFASYDGLEIPGVLYRPREANAENPVPAIVFVHGGPGGQSTKGYRAHVQHLVNNGYAVYAINNRGSSGYGKTFFSMDNKKHGDVDLRDVTASAEWLKGLDWIADDRIAIMGGSYGGYITAAALAFHPQVFDAGINIFGVTNWVRTLESIPPWWESFKESLFDEMGDPATDGERHRAISPLFHAGNIVKPLLVVQGANDPRVLQVESDELVEAVRANGVPVEYVLFPDEGHGFSKKVNRIAASEAYLKFLDEHIGR
ncbi:S9 family peptidase [Pacificimonas sp. WHA3]|uniref:S9 family peptidase n=1 Tax=Pacificimonas pallii TaxID=2827236 RepID=A0ABS6SDB1_9SPHN|nr:S9 family peptidase [Pacificimonas pallii]MBV7256404.1 S9 family peptidase [Pacificimonas pallii]